MLTGLYARLIALAAIGLLIVALWVAGDVHGHHVVQARWDAAKAAQAQSLADAHAEAAAKTAALQDALTQSEAKYEDAIHAQVPSVADSVAAGVHAGTVQLRDSTCPTTGDVPITGPRSRAADAAATQALADRIQAAIAAVRAADEADAREHKLDAQIDALQSILRAERAPAR